MALPTPTGFDIVSKDNLNEHQTSLPGKEPPPPNQEPSSTFSLFPMLSAEIRIKIWHTYLFTPRLVTISADPSSCFASADSSSKKIHIMRNAPSTLLSVNSESRHEALRHYSSLRSAGKIQRYRLPYSRNHQTSTKGFYRRPGDDVVYLKGCYYHPRWFHDAGVVGREIIAEHPAPVELPPKSNVASEAESKDAEGREKLQMNPKVPMVGRIKTLALDEAFLSDEALFGRHQFSPVMFYLMRDLKGLEMLIVVRMEGLETGEDEIRARIENARRDLVVQSELWRHMEDVEALRSWECPALKLMGRRELGLLCGEHRGIIE